MYFNKEIFKLLKKRIKQYRCIYVIIEKEKEREFHIIGCKITQELKNFHIIKMYIKINYFDFIQIPFWL